MIRRIVLHIGVHKTASTTIQNSLSLKRQQLAAANVLYPAFQAGQVRISNHSIPFFSLFSENPDKYHFNISQGYTTTDSIGTLHREYSLQLKKQISCFEGDTMVISGEDISHLSSGELRSLRTYLSEVTNPDVKIEVLLFCRHPVTRFRSAVQASICHFGMTMKNAVEYHLYPRRNYFQNLTGTFSDIFGHENISVLRYEDAIAHPRGPAGAVLRFLDPSLPEKIKPEPARDNPGQTYETVILFDAINRTFPEKPGYVLAPDRMVILNQMFSDIPGPKFRLRKGESRMVWNELSEDINRLCREFSLPEYAYSSEDLDNETNIWDIQTTGYIERIFAQLTPEYRKAIRLLFLRTSLGGQSLNFTKRKRLFLFSLTDVKF